MISAPLSSTDYFFLLDVNAIQRAFGVIVLFREKVAKQPVAEGICRMMRSQCKSEYRGENDRWKNFFLMTIFRVAISVKESNKKNKRFNDLKFFTVRRLRE